MGDVLSFPFLGIRSLGGEGATLFSPFVSFFVVSPRGAERGLRKIPIFFEAGWDSSLFWISTPLSSRHLWVLIIPLNTFVALFSLSCTWPGLLLSIPCWMTLRALANFSIFSLCSIRSWRTFFHPSIPGGAPPWPKGRLLSLPTRPFWHSQEKDFFKVPVQEQSVNSVLSFHFWSLLLVINWECFVCCSKNLFKSVTNLINYGLRY